MTTDLTNSTLHRQNVLNNNLAVKEVYEQLGFTGVLFRGQHYFTKAQVASFYEVDEKTIERLIEANIKEITKNGYEVITGTLLKEAYVTFAGDIDVSRKYPNFEYNSLKKYLESIGFSPKTRSISLFSFRALLNMGMLLTTSEKAKEVRSFVLNVVIDVLNKKLGGNTRYINQRDEDYLPSATREYNFRKEFTDALDKYMEPGKFKYPQMTDKVYTCIFKGKAKEYRQVLKLKPKDNVRATMYAEVLDLIAAYENGFANYLRKESQALARKLTLTEGNQLFSSYEEEMEHFVKPLREKARSLMASRDMAFRDALHEKLKDYVEVVSSDDFEKFLGEKSMALEERIKENIDVFKRLKDR